MSDRNHLTEEEAARLWQRAAALQAEAARDAEMPGEADRGEVDDVSTDDGYALEHVRAAALEAGIGAEYLDAALVDLRAERVLPSAPDRGVFARWILPPLPDAITVKRVIEASPAKVLQTMEEVLPEAPYRLTLADQKGNVLEGGVLVFDIEGASFAASGGFTGDASAADLRQVYVSMHTMEADENRCELTLRGPVAWAERLNAGIGGVMIGMTSAGGLGLGWAGGSALAAAVTAGGIATVPVAAAVAAGLSVAGLLGGAGAGAKGFRWLYAYSLRKGEGALEGLLSVIAVRAQGGWLLGGERIGAESAESEVPKLAP